MRKALLADRLFDGDDFQVGRALLLEDGKILGIMRDVPVKEGEEPRQERITEPKRIDETEWTDRTEFEKELTALNEQNSDFELAPVDVATVYYNAQANRDMTIKEFVDTNMEPSLVLYLSDYGFFKNLEL